MSQIIEKYHAAIVDCIILEDEFDRFLKQDDRIAAKDCLKELVSITTKWITNILGLKQVLEERGNTASIATLDYYLSAFDEFNQGSINRADVLIKIMKGQ